MRYALVKDTLSPRLSELFQEIGNPVRALSVAAAAMQRAYCDHFRSRGGRQFWAGIANAVQIDDPEDGVSAGIVVGGNRGALLLHKIQGGKIVAKTGKNLAIPACDEARKLGSPSYWSKPGDGKLTPVFKGRRIVALAFAMDFGHGKSFQAKAARLGKARTGSKAQGKGIIAYWLTPSVDQAADPQALPSSQVVLAEVRQALDELRDRIIKGKPGGAAGS
jgi:hypothetical protein